jgi:hypothetical protein
MGGLVKKKPPSLVRRGRLIEGNGLREIDEIYRKLPRKRRGKKEVLICEPCAGPCCLMRLSHLTYVYGRSQEKVSKKSKPEKREKRLGRGEWRMMGNYKIINKLIDF